MLRRRNHEARMGISREQKHQCIVVEFGGIVYFPRTGITCPEMAALFSHRVPRNPKRTMELLQEAARIGKQRRGLEINLHYPINLGASFLGSNWMMNFPSRQIASHASKRGHQP